MCNTVKGKKEAGSGFPKRFWKITGRLLRTAAAKEPFHKRIKSNVFSL